MNHSIRISGLVVEYIIAIDVTRVRFPADAYLQPIRHYITWGGAPCADLTHILMVAITTKRFPILVMLSSMQINDWHAMLASVRRNTC